MIFRRVCVVQVADGRSLYAWDMLLAPFLIRCVTFRTVGRSFPLPCLHRENLWVMVPWDNPAGSFRRKYSQCIQCMDSGDGGYAKGEGVQARPRDTVRCLSAEGGQPVHSCSTPGSALEDSSPYVIDPMYVGIDSTLLTSGVLHAFLQPARHCSLITPSSPADHWARTFPQTSPLLLVAHHGGSNYKPKSVRPAETLPPRLRTLADRVFLFPVWRMLCSRHCHLSFRTSGLPAMPAWNSTTSSSVKPTSTTASL